MTNWGQIADFSNLLPETPPSLRTPSQQLANLIWLLSVISSPVVETPIAIVRDYLELLDDDP